MNASRRARFGSGAGLALLVLALTARPLLERDMVMHMLVQIPALLLAGVAIGTAVPHCAPLSRWNEAGVPALFAASLILTFWMIPIAIDHAVEALGWDMAKAASIAFAGAIAAISWRIAPTVVQAFFVGNLVWMAIVVGQLYQDEGSRLCNAYLQSDQAVTGVALTGLAITVGTLWTAFLVFANRGRRTG